jgi:hypothetical protein
MEKPKKQNKPAERVSLTPANIRHIEGMLGQIRNFLPELKLGRSDLVNWLLQSRSHELSKKEMSALARDHFDPVKALEAAMVEAKALAGRGEAIDLQALLNEKLDMQKRTRSNRRPVRSRQEIAKRDAAKGSLE